MKFKSNWAKNTYWQMIDGEKIFFVENEKVGAEYILVRNLVISGMTSSSGARKILEKIKEKPS